MHRSRADGVWHDGQRAESRRAQRRRRRQGQAGGGLVRVCPARRAAPAGRSRGAPARGRSGHHRSFASARTLLVPPMASGRTPSHSTSWLGRAVGDQDVRLLAAHGSSTASAPCTVGRACRRPAQARGIRRWIHPAPDDVVGDFLESATRSAGVGSRGGERLLGAYVGPFRENASWPVR